MTTRAQLYQGAHLLLKEIGTDVTVSDDTRFVNTLNLVYDSTLSFMLEAGFWNFATRTVAIEADASEEPDFGYSFAIPKPDDYAGRIVAISGDQRFSQPVQDYQEEGGLSGFIFCDLDPLYLRYISNGVAYGMNLADWPYSYTRAVEYELAFRIAPHLTSMGEESMVRLEKRKEKALRDAKSKDAVNQGATWPPAGRLATSRGGRSSMRNRWR